jgi:hypothetical protein
VGLYTNVKERVDEPGIDCVAGAGPEANVTVAEPIFVRYVPIISWLTALKSAAAVPELTTFMITVSGCPTSVNAGSAVNEADSEAGVCMVRFDDSVMAVEPSPSVAFAAPEKSRVPGAPALNTQL